MPRCFARNRLPVLCILSVVETPNFRFAKPDFVLAPVTYYKIGGPAQWALFPETVEEAADAFAWLQMQPAPWLVLGGGSNVLISDAGFPGVVLFTSGLNRLTPLGAHRRLVEAGVALDRLVREVLVANNYEGTAALAGIPGTVGGALFMNAGTVNGSTCDYVESVDVATAGGLRTVPVGPSGYSYRGQTFCRDEDLIVRAVFRFTRTAERQKAVYDHYLARRRERQPDGRCCGSVFKNPEHDHAGRLIEACGLKGARHGGAVVSAQHANFILNENNATFDDITGLIALCKRTVRARFGIELKEEVRIVGGKISEDAG